MKFRKKIPVAIGFGLLGIVNIPALADTNAPAATTMTDQQMLAAYAKRMDQLSAEVNELKGELKTVEAQQQAGESVHHRHVAGAQVQPISATGVPLGPPVRMQTQPDSNGNPQTLTQQVGLQKTNLQGTATPVLVPVEPLVDSPSYIGGEPVTTSPYIGVHSEFNASDLIVNLPFVNEDLNLIQQRQKAENVYTQLGLPFPTHPFVEMSGQIQGYTYESRPFVGDKTSDIDLATAEIDTNIVVDPWVTGFMAITYDNTPPATGQRAFNSRLYLNRGFVTIGDLNKFPMYGTIGQAYVAFGQYNSNMISNTLTRLLARTKGREIALGYDKAGTVNGLSASMYTFRGDSSATAGGTDQINQLGGNVDYNITETNWNGNLGGGLISNIADSEGMQGTNITPGDLKSYIPTGFPGFGGGRGLPTSAGELLVHRVPAYDLHGNLGIGKWSLTTEYIGSTTSFSPMNMTMNNVGARPAAFNSELNYSFDILGRPSGFAVGYGFSKDALAILLPAQRYIATFNTSIWRDTVESLEYRHDINYSSGSTATGQGISVQASGTGRSADAITASISAFF